MCSCISHDSSSRLLRGTWYNYRAEGDRARAEHQVRNLSEHVTAIRQDLHDSWLQTDNYTIQYYGLINT